MFQNSLVIGSVGLVTCILICIDEITCVPFPVSELRHRGACLDGDGHAR